ncbi:hypothetical protein MRX96_029424 [Rhipicephalus microplus]
MLVGVDGVGTRKRPHQEGSIPSCLFPACNAVGTPLKDSTHRDHQPAGHGIKSAASSGVTLAAGTWCAGAGDASTRKRTGRVTSTRRTTTSRPPWYFQRFVPVYPVNFRP